MTRRNLISAAGATALSTRRVLGANDRIRVALLGSGGRGQYVSGLVRDAPNTQFIAACDVYEPRRIEAAAKLGVDCKPASDYRAVLDDKSIDAVVIGSPDHWHLQMTVDAVAAGKDVYVEKPVTHSLEEGPRLIEAVRGSGRVVATGTQQRAWDHFILAKQLIDEGQLGRVILAQCWWYQNYLRSPPPAVKFDVSKLDVKAWLGSAREQPMTERKFRTWRFFWDFGGGAFTDLMTHWIDVIMWYMKSPVPESVTASGALYAVPGIECPDTVSATLLFPQNYTAVYHGSMTESIEDGGIILRGTAGTMRLTRGGFAVYREDVRARDWTAMPEPTMLFKATGDGTRSNVADWLDCIRSRKQPKADVVGGVQCAAAAHWANQAMRSKQVVRVSDQPSAGSGQPVIA